MTRREMPPGMLLDLFPINVSPEWFVAYFEAGGRRKGIVIDRIKCRPGETVSLPVVDADGVIRWGECQFRFNAETFTFDRIATPWDDFYGL